MNKRRISEKVISSIKQMYNPLMALIVSFVLVSIIIKLMGSSPLAAYKILLTSSVTSVYGWGEVFAKAIPLLMAALSYAIAFKSGMVNLGANGQMYMGGIAAMLAATNFEGMPAVFHITLVLALGILAGAAWGILAAFLKNRFGASEVVTTMMLNYIALYFCTFLISGPMKDAKGDLAQSAPALASAQLPILIKGTRWHAGLLIAVLVIGLYYILMNRSTLGYEMRVVGMNSSVGKYAGMKINKVQLMSMGLAGAIAGLGGAMQATVIDGKLTMGWVGNLGFDGLAVSCLGGETAVGIAAAAVFFGLLLSGASKMEMLAHVPGSVIYLFQGIVIIFVIGRRFFQFEPVKRQITFQKKKQYTGEGGTA